MDTSLPFGDGLSLRITETASAENPYATSRLQRGLLLVDGADDLAEEAVGFGVPVLKRGLETIFPGKATLTSLHEGSTRNITALYELNLVERFSRAGSETLENELFYASKNFVAAVIRHLPFLGDLLTATSSTFRRLLNWHTTYVDAGFSAQVKVTYVKQDGTREVAVEIDAHALPPGITEMVVMNEQGAHHFDRYSDSAGLSLQGQRIGYWTEVKAEEAWFESSTRRIAFRLGRVAGARLFRGRELIGSRLAWAGFGYSCAPSRETMRYTVAITRLP